MVMEASSILMEALKKSITLTRDFSHNVRRHSTSSGVLRKLFLF